MFDFNGIKREGCYRCDGLEIWANDAGHVGIATSSGWSDGDGAAFFDPATARLIAAALIEAADKAEAGQ
jgi:hypothetical protein